MQFYPTDLTDSQWAKIEKLFDMSFCKYSLVPDDSAHSVPPIPE